MNSVGRAPLLLALLVAVPALAAPPESGPMPRQLDRHGDPLPEGAIARFGSVRLRHGAWIGALAYSPNGRSVVAGDRDGFIRLWRASTGREEWSVCPYQTVDDLAFAPTGDLLASAGPTDEGSAVHLLGATTGRESCRLLRTRERVAALAFSPNGKVLAIAVPNDHVILGLDAISGKVLFRLKSFCTERQGFAFSPNGLLIAGPGIDGRVRLWRVPAGEEVALIEQSPAGCEAIQFSPDGTELAVRGLDCIGVIADGSAKCSVSERQRGLSRRPFGENHVNRAFRRRSLTALGRARSL